MMDKETTDIVKLKEIIKEDKKKKRTEPTRR